MTGNMIQNIMIQIFTSFFYNEQYPTEVIENTLMVVNKNSPVFKNKKIKLENLKKREASVHTLKLQNLSFFCKTVSILDANTVHISTTIKVT